MADTILKAIRVGNVGVNVLKNDEGRIILELPSRAKVVDVDDLKKALDEAHSFVVDIATTGWCRIEL